MRYRRHPSIRRMKVRLELRLFCSIPWGSYFIAGSLSDDGSIDLMFNNISRERKEWDSFLKELKEARKNRYPISLFYKQCHSQRCVNSMQIRHITDEQFKQYKAEVNKFENDMKMVSDISPQRTNWNLKIISYKIF